LTSASNATGLGRHRLGDHLLADAVADSKLFAAEPTRVEGDHAKWMPEELAAMKANAVYPMTWAGAPTLHRPPLLRHRRQQLAHRGVGCTAREMTVQGQPAAMPSSSD